MAARKTKYLALAALVRKRAGWKRARKTVVFTNGIFDLLHRGHVEYLAKAKAQGDILIVGLNSDASTRRLKGPNRPLNKLADRAAVLAALETVDYIVSFGQDTPLKLITAIKPDILVKGADYTEDTVVGRSFVESYGGRVELAPLVEGMSSTGIVSRIVNGEGPPPQRQSGKK